MALYGLDERGSLKRIQTFIRNTMTQERLNALAMLSMEKRLVTEMRNWQARMKGGQNVCSSTATGQCRQHYSVLCCF